MRVKTIYLNTVILVIVTITNTYPQGGWKKQYYLHESFGGSSRGVLVTPDGNYITAGFSYAPAGPLTLIKTDKQGNLLWRKDYGTSDFRYLYNVFQPPVFGPRNSSEFYIVVSAKDKYSSNKSIGVLIKFNYDGDTLWQKVYRETHPKDIMAQGSCRSADGGFLITGATQNWESDGGGRLLLLIKTDDNGNELWRKRISKPEPNVQDGKCIIQDSVTKQIIIVGYQNKELGTYSNIMILDSLGKLQVHTTLNNAGGGGGFGHVIQLKDGNFLSCGSWREFYINGYSMVNSLLIKFDINGKEIWSTKINSPTLYNSLSLVHERPNSDIMAVGWKDTVANGYAAKTLVYNFDKNGKLKWKKIIGSAYDEGHSEGPVGFEPTGDGGYILATGFPYLNPTPFSLIKIDSLACDTLAEYCTQPYYVGLEELSGISDRNFRAFPNPANGAFTIESDKETELSIINTLGQEITTVKLDRNSGFKSEVKGLAAGVYFIQVKGNRENDSYRFTQKIVVQ